MSTVSHAQRMRGRRRKMVGRRRTSSGRAHSFLPVHRPCSRPLVPAAETRLDCGPRRKRYLTHYVRPSALVCSVCVEYNQQRGRKEGRVSSSLVPPSMSSSSLPIHKGSQGECDSRTRQQRPRVSFQSRTWREEKRRLEARWLWWVRERRSWGPVVRELRHLAGSHASTVRIFGISETQYSFSCRQLKSKARESS